MPQGFGYGPLPPPPGLLDQPLGLPRPMLPMAEQPMPAAALSSPIPATMMPPPVIAEEPQLPAPSGLGQAEQRPALVPTWLQEILGQQQPDTAVDASPVSSPPDPRDPIALATAAANARVKAEQVALGEMRQADAAIDKANENLQKRESARAERERIARENVAKQNTQIQQALKQGPGTTWRDVAATGIQVVGAVLGAAFDRSGMLQKSLPNLLQAYVQQGQERTQAAFARQLQALQVGRQSAGDELDAAMDDERRIEQAGAAAQKAILDESQRQIDIAMREGSVTLAQLEAAGIPAQMEAMQAAAEAKQAELEAEAQRKAVEQGLELQEKAAGIRYKEEQIVSERAKRALDREQLGLSRERLEMEREARETQSVKDEVDLHDKRLAVALKSKDLEAKDRDRAIILPDGRPVLLNSTAEGAQKQAVAKVATARKLGRLVDEIVQASERTGYDPKWLGSTEGQKTRLLWRKLWLSVKDQEELGAITGPDEKVLDDVTGADPTSFSPEALRGVADKLRLLKRTTEDEVDDYLSTSSSDYVGQAKRFSLPLRDDPDKAVPGSKEAVKALLPIQSAVSGQRPRVKPEEFAGHIKTVRETIAKEVAAGQRADVLTDERLSKEDIVRVQALELASSLKGMRGERQRLEQERAATQERARQATGTGKTDLLKRMQALTSEISTVEQYEKRLSKELETDRRLLYQRIRGGDARAQRNVSPADREAYRAVSDLIGEIK